MREVPFDGGAARIEPRADGSERVLLRRADGGTAAESTCAAPASYDAVRSFFTAVRAAALAAEPQRVAALVAFPLRVNGAVTRNVRSRQQFVREYGRIFTPGVVNAVVTADPGQVFCNWQGVMLGDGVLWADVQSNGQLAVTVINFPTPRSGATRR